MNRTTRALLRGLALAVLTWIVFAAMAAVAVTSLVAELPAERSVVGLPTEWGNAFVDVLIFDFGRSEAFDESALSIVFESLGDTGVLLLETVVLVAVLGVGLHRLTRRSARGRRVTETLGYVGALPASAWLFGLLWVGQTTGVGLFQSPATGPIGYLVPAIALALPLAAFVARNVSHATADRDWVLEGWLFVSWTLSTIVVVEPLFGISGLGLYLSEFFTLRDPAGLAAVLGVLTVLALPTSLVREVAWDTSNFPPSFPWTVGDDSTVVEGETTPPDPATVVRTNRRVRVGLGLFVLLLVVGILGRAFYAPGIRDAGGRILHHILTKLDHVTVRAVVAATVAGGVGVVLGIVAVRVASGRNVTAILAGYAMNVPLLVWMWLLVSIDTGVFPTVAAMGFAVAPLVGMAVARDVERTDGVSVGIVLPAIGIAVTGAAVVALVSAHVLGPPSFRGLLETRADQLAAGFLREAIGVGAPVLSLFLLGSGLRSHWSTS